MFTYISPYRYRRPTVYLFVCDIINPDLLARSFRTWISLDIARFYEELFASNGSELPTCPQNDKFDPH